MSTRPSHRQSATRGARSKAGGGERTAARGARRRAAPVKGDPAASVVVRRSPFHGLGVFATVAIPKGTRVLEYTGERISHDEAAERYYDERLPHAHVLLFTVDRKTVIDGAVGEGSARYVNHSCDPNCTAVIVRRRVYIETILDVAAGTELTYDYSLTRPEPLPRDWRRRYACRCDAPRCRGTMLGRPPREKTR